MRYSRQMVLPQIGAEGQKALARTRILCVGAGGLGSPVLSYLAAAGIGFIRIVDGDGVEESNLQRQVLFSVDDLGANKAVAAAVRLRQLNPDLQIEPIGEMLRESNAERMMADVDIIVDGSDNFATKYLINDTAVKLGKPVVYGSVLGFVAHVSTFWAAKGPCLRCLFPEVPRDHIPSCADAGVLGAVVGMAGSLQALEAIKLALGTEHCAQHQLQTLIGILWQMDAHTMQVQHFRTMRDEACGVCR